MKTIVELYDKEPLENILSACVFEPDMVVYICDARDSSLRKETAVERLFKSRGLRTQSRFYYINTSDVTAIWKTMEAICRDYPDCAFDCTGGKDLVLLVAGIFCKEKNVRAYYIDLERKKLVNLCGCEDLAERFCVPQFTAEDVFSLAGAKLVRYGHFSPAEMSEEFERSVPDIWDIVLKNPEAWGGAVGYFQAAGVGKQEEDLWIRAPKTIRVNKQVTARCNENILERLASCGAIQRLTVQGDEVQFRYRDEQMKKCLQNHGIWLELYGYFAARQSGLFGDVRTSVIVDWDNAHGRTPSTRNEIDILIVEGVTPVFISCKMGVPSPLALTEIKILSQKFGGERTRTVMLTAANVHEENRPLSQRARDLGITLLDRGNLQRNEFVQSIQRVISK